MLLLSLVLAQTWAPVICKTYSLMRWIGFLLLFPFLYGQFQCRSYSLSGCDAVTFSPKNKIPCKDYLYWHYNIRPYKGLQLSSNRFLMVNPVRCNAGMFLQVLWLDTLLTLHRERFYPLTGAIDASLVEVMRQDSALLHIALLEEHSTGIYFRIVALDTAGIVTGSKGFALQYNSCPFGFYQGVYTGEIIGVFERQCYVVSAAPCESRFAWGSVTNTGQFRWQHTWLPSQGIIGSGIHALVPYQSGYIGVFGGSQGCGWVYYDSLMMPQKWMKLPFSVHEQNLFCATCSQGQLYGITALKDSALLLYGYTPYLNNDGADVLLIRLKDSSKQWIRIVGTEWIDVPYIAIEGEDSSLWIGGTQTPSSDSLYYRGWLMKVDRDGKVEWMRMFPMLQVITFIGVYGQDKLLLGGINQQGFLTLLTMDIWGNSCSGCGSFPLSIHSLSPKWFFVEGASSVWEQDTLQAIMPGTSVNVSTANYNTLIQDACP